MISTPITHPLILGAGSWGTALATLLATNSKKVTLFGREDDSITQINQQHRNTRYLPDILLPQNIRATTDPSLCQSAELILFVVPTSAIRELAQNIQKIGIPKETILLSCAKGIERETGKRMSEIISEAFPENPVAVLSGPNHAEEIACGLPAAASLASPCPDTSRRLQDLLTTTRFRTYTCDDLPGVELGGAIKNVFAIAAGVAKGLNLGDNAISALVTRGLAEMIRLGTALGGKPETFTGLSGVGDLITTCFSDHSRNHRVGVALGQGSTLKEAVDALGMVAEGVPNTRSIYEASQRLDCRTPLIDTVYALLYQDVPAPQALNALFARSPRDETE